MKLKVKFLKISAGRPVVIINKKFAETASIHVDDRLLLSHDHKKIVSVVDISSGLVGEDEIIVSTEIVQYLCIKEGDYVSVELSLKPDSISLIHKKLTCQHLSRSELKEVIQDIVDNALTEAEIAYFISGVYKCGMSMEEIVNLTKAIIETGKTLKLSGKIADKHSTGGTPGRTTPIVVSICAAAGLIMPKTSSRAITSPAGTADAMEVICKVDFSIPEIKRIVKKIGACLVWGGSLNLAPADDKIIQVEKLLNLDPEPQLLASIIAKKLSVGAKIILIDIPYGKNAKVNKKEAFELKRRFEALGRHFKVRLKCSLKSVEEPLGDGVGPALEIKDVIRVLKRESACHMLESRSLELAGELLELAGKTKKGRGYSLAKEILDSKLAFKKFEQIVKAQQGRLNTIGVAKYSAEIKSKKNFTIKEIVTQEINTIARIAGCPLGKYAGIYLCKHVGDKAKKGEPLLTIYSENETELKEAVKYYKKIKPVR